MNVIDQASIDIEAAKPEYANFRGMVARDGTPLDQHYARVNIARGAGADRAEAYRDAMAERIGSAHQLTPLNDNTPSPLVAKDGRAFDSLTPSEQARERMSCQLSEAYKG